MKIVEWRLAIATAVVASACARPEQSLLEQFFAASRLRDTTALQAVSTVVFEPRQDGIIRTFEIASVTPERIQQAVVEKDVTIQAPVMVPDGGTVRKILVITMQRAGEAGSRWRVVAFRDVAASPPTPQS